MGFNGVQEKGMRRVAAAIAMIAAALSSAQAQGGQWGTLFLARLLPTHTIANLYAGREMVIAQYTVAMRRYKAAGERGLGDRLAIAFQPSGAAPALEPFTWVAANGDMVRRIGNGVFAVSAGSQLGNWYVDVTCQVVLWPTLACADGSERKIAAPDLETLLLDGVEFKRPYPKAELPPEEDLATIPPDEQQ